MLQLRSCMLALLVGVGSVCALGLFLRQRSAFKAPVGRLFLDIKEVGQRLEPPIATSNSKQDVMYFKLGSVFFYGDLTIHDN